MTQVATALAYFDFVSCVRSAEQRFQANWLNAEQDAAVAAPPAPPVFIVAGPGTGKTTVLALRVLRHVCVDGFDPAQVMATTFTRKAARELRSRILAWGVNLQAEAVRRATAAGNRAQLAWLNSIDINMVRTGTLDALAEEMITDDRQPGQITPTVIEAFMASGILRRKVLFPGARYNDPDLVQRLRVFNPKYPSASGFAERLAICQAFADRALHDGVDLVNYATTGTGHRRLADVVRDYQNTLRGSDLMDFAMLEDTVLTRLQQGRLTSTVDRLQALLVDEFQDTNLLQEQIYYELCRRSNAALTVVGDDDQSVYRFRGATVEIFAGFPSRLVSALGQNWQPTRVDLVDNYRSTSRIVRFFNGFIAAEPTFLGARAPGKLPCVPAATWANNPTTNYPVLGMFRTTVADLARDLCGMLGDIFRGSGYTIPISGSTPLTIRPGQGGDFGDAVLLAWKVREEKDDGTPRLPLLVRQNLRVSYNVDVFNPRGRALSSIPEVARLLGLMLLCIDPNSSVQNSITTFRARTLATFNMWRTQATQFISTNPAPGGLPQFIADWRTLTARTMRQWPREWPLLALMFTLETWFPTLQRSPEGQVYLETVARVIAEAAQISPFESMLLVSGSQLDQRAVQAAIREVFEPIAEGNADVDEELMPYVPRSTFPIMTIHQAKGLEFPMVIVDVGSDFRTNHAAQRARRFPDDGDNEHYTEDEVSQFSPVGPTRLQRSRRQRAFDDIRRLYYVAKSRPQYILLLAGLTTQLGTPPRVLSVATGDLLAGGRAMQFAPASTWTPASPDNFVALI